MLSDGRRVDLGRYADEHNAQEISRGLNDGTLAVDADNRLYRVNEGEHIDRRSSVTVGQRSMNAFQFDHPELHQYFRDAAADLAEELSYAEKGGEIVRRTSREAGDDEYVRTRRAASERIARLLDDERIGYDDIDRAVTALIHDEGQENFAAAKRVELMLDNMLMSGYTDIHGRYVAPNEQYIAAKQAIRGADASAQTHEELPLWDLPEAQNGGSYGQNETRSTRGAEPAEGSGQRADAVAAEGDLYRGDGGWGSAEHGPRGTEELRGRAEKERRNQPLAERRRAEAVMQPLTSSAALGVSGGTDNALVHVLPEERWDDELRGVADFAKKNGIRRVTMVTGLLEVDTGAGTVPVSGCIDREKGEMVLRVDSTHGTATELARHEIGHAVTQERSVRAFMQEVQAGGNGWQEIYRAYERRYAALTRNYIGMTPEERALYVWEEILEDAYAGLDSYGHDASRYHDAAVRAIEEPRVAGAPARRESEGLQLRAVDEEKSRGPPEKFSVLEEVEGENGTYGKGVMLDTNLFDGIRPRDWGKTLGRYVYNNMAGMELTAYDAAGKPETIYLARTNDRVQKDGAKNSRKVIDKLARSTGDNIRSLAVVHLDEALTTSRYENSTDEHNHQWMDENGWEYRKTYALPTTGTACRRSSSPSF